MLAFGTFASAYVARMIGAIIFGHFGDRVGRKSMLLVSLLTMGAATFAIGLLPDYNTIGVMAPLLLLLLRVIQGLALGGEWGGAVLMTVEHAPAHRRGFYGSLVQVGVPAGTLIANIVFLIAALTMSSDSLHAWGWRIPFLASALLVAVGIYIRLHIEETPSFQAVKSAGAKAKMPFASLMAKYWKQVVLGGVATLSTGSTFTLLVASGVAYGKKELGHSESLMLWVVLASCALCFVLIPFFGNLSDKYGRKPIIYAGVAAEALFAFPMFWLMDTKSVALLFVAYLVMMTALPPTTVPSPPSWPNCLAPRSAIPDCPWPTCSRVCWAVQPHRSSPHGCSASRTRVPRSPGTSWVPHSSRSAPSSF